MMKPIRIMHVVHSLGTGGTEAGIRKLLSGFDPEVFEQSVCTVVAGPPFDPQTGARLVSLGRARRSSGLLMTDFYRLFRRERPHIVHARNWGTIEAVPAAKLARVPGVIYSEHGLDLSTVNVQPWRRNAFRRFCFRYADRVFAVSQGLRDYFVRQLGLPPQRLPVIANGVDTERYRPVSLVREEMRQKLGLSRDLFTVGTVSRLDPVKDHGTLFRAAEALLGQGCALQVIVVGDGPQRAALERCVGASQLLRNRVLFTGSRSDIAQWLQSFDVFVLPSLAEGMSNTLLEAMASGVAPVASRVGGNPEVIEEGMSGLLFEAGDANALAACLKALALDPQRRHEMGTRARRRVMSRFSLKDMLENYGRLYEGLWAGDAIGNPAGRQHFVGRQQRVSGVEAAGKSQ